MIKEPTKFVVLAENRTWEFKARDKRDAMDWSKNKQVYDDSKANKSLLASPLVATLMLITTMIKISVIYKEEKIHDQPLNMK